MKCKLMIFFKSLAVSLGCLLLIAEIGYYNLIPTQKAVENKQEKIPYSFVPENAGIVFEFYDKSTLIYLDFESNCVCVLFGDKEKFEFYGYSSDYTVEGDYSLLGGIIDAAGGINLNLNGEILAYTGIQIQQILSVTHVTDDLRCEITKQILYSISQNGFSREDFLYVIEKGKTNLTIPDCYYWQDSIKNLCKTVRIIN